WAAERDDIDAAQLLLARNPRVNLQDRQGVTALIAAARRGSIEVVRALLARKANPNIADFTGRTALSHALRNNRQTIASLLRAAGGKE
ncbi:MAG: ankyrin repeat domain-containing protein, partial [Alphaproteobacteria bacterium]|nr:ankyrin repeat domain-containing protein [Alphaproteobacteria bacterium]